MDKMLWDLSVLYSSFEAKEFAEDVEKIEKHLYEINDWTEKNLDGYDNWEQTIKGYLKISIKISENLRKLFAYCSLIQSADSGNVKAMQNLAILQNKATKFTNSNVAFNKWLAKIEDFESKLSKSDNDFILEHNFIINQTYKNTKYLLSDAEELMAAELSSTGSTAWSTLQSKLTSELMVDIEVDGKKERLPLPVVRNMVFDKNLQKRKTAFEAEINSYSLIADSSAAALNAIKGEVLTMSKKRGYKSPLEKTLISSRLEKATLDALLSAIKDNQQIFVSYLKAKANHLGQEKGLNFYDLFAPIGKAGSAFSYDQAHEFIVDKFSSFSSKLADFADHAFKNNWIDAKPRQGKRGGAFCSGLHSQRQCRILTNFTGSFSDVTTLAHELGHGYHGMCLYDASPLNSGYPMPLAETASIFCETIVNKAVAEQAEGDELLNILESSVSDSTQVIIDIFSRYIFESNFFAKREIAPLATDEIKELMLKAQKEAYGEGLNPDCLHPYMWVCKPHYYSAGLNFYNFPYAFGLLFAKGLYAIYQKDQKSFLAKYDELLVATGKNSVEECAKIIGIDVTKKDFWNDSIKIIKEDIDKLVTIL